MRQIPASKKLKTIFMGTPDFAVSALEALHEVSEVVAVYSQPDRPIGRGQKLKAPPVKRWAVEHGIEVRQPSKLSDPGETERLEADAPDLVVVAAYAQLLKQAVLDIPRLGCINVHSSLLPRWRGAAPIQHAIMAGDSETGVTIMRMVKKLDAGNMILQKKIPITKSTTAGTLHDDLATLGGELLKEAVEQLESASATESLQDETLVTYASKLEKGMERLDLTRGATELSCHVRAMSPWPGTSLQVEGMGRLKILEVGAQSKSVQVGQIVFDIGRVLLGCGEGSLELKRMQWEGKKPLAAGEWLNGLKGRGVNLPLKVD